MLYVNRGKGVYGYMLLQGAYKQIKPATGAVIMANGIFLIGSIEAFPILDIQMGKYLAFILLVLWVMIYKSLTIQFFHRNFLIPFITHPVQSFTIGTWIAGVSVLCNVFLKYFPNILLLTQAMALLNTFLWLFFLVNCIYNFKQLIFNQPNYPVHGILLMSTVGTQSIIVLLNNVFSKLPALVSEMIIILGIIFYMIGMFFIIKRYVSEKNWTLADNWPNTNCIIHGALSITGLAIVSSNTFSASFLIILWISIVLLLVIIETIEIYRAVARVQLYGWNKGLFTYHVSQWSRNFTFGMFYTFTLYLHHNPYYVIPQALYVFQESFIAIWAWIVLFSLIGQIAIYIKSRFSSTIYDRREKAS